MQLCLRSRTAFGTTAEKSGSFYSMPTLLGMTETGPLSLPETGGSTLLEELPAEHAETFLDEGDHERFAHYVRKEKILESAMSGEPVIALCGKVWVPGRDPSKFPVCPDCKAIYDGLPPGKGSSDD